MAFANGQVLFIEMEKKWKEKFQGKDQMLSFRHVKYEIAIKVFKCRYQIGN